MIILEKKSTVGGNYPLFGLIISLIIVKGQSQIEFLIMIRRPMFHIKRIVQVHVSNFDSKFPKSLNSLSFEKIIFFLELVTIEPCYPSNNIWMF